MRSRWLHSLRAPVHAPLLLARRDGWQPPTRTGRTWFERSDRSLRYSVIFSPGRSVSVYAKPPCCLPIRPMAVGHVERHEAAGKVSLSRLVCEAYNGGLGFGECGAVQLGSDRHAGPVGSGVPVAALATCFSLSGNGALAKAVRDQHHKIRAIECAPWRIFGTPLPEPGGPCPPPARSTAATG